MQSQVLNRLKQIWSIAEKFRLKVLFITLTFFLMMGCQAIWRPLKTAIFSKIVGASYTPDAKLYTLLLIIPLTILYSYLVDQVRRHQLVYCFTLFHAFGGIIFYFLLSHPIYGIANTAQSPSRIIGWAFYLFLESFGAFLAAVFWGFANSVNKPKDAKNFYGIFVAGSKLGGIIAAGLLYWFVTYTTIPDNILLPNYILLGSGMLLAASLCIYLLMKFVPGYYMHGYEAAYQQEKQRMYDSSKQSFVSSLRKSVDGLLLIIKNPYVFGIFSIVLFYDIISAIFDYRVLRLADATYATAGGLTSFFSLYYMCMHSVGLIVSLFGTTPILRFVGTRTALFIFPLLTIVIIGISYLFPYARVLFITLVLFRSLNYSMNHPIREVLYIPTTKDIKFKAKAWIDAFGSRIAKGTGSVFNKATNGMIPTAAILYSTSLNISLAALWIIVVYFLGKQVQEAIDKKHVIGTQTSNHD